jgi:glutathione S-transferase
VAATYHVATSFPTGAGLTGDRYSGLMAAPTGASRPGELMSYIYTAAATLLALLLYLVLTIVVARARTKYGVKAPAVTGNENFERTYRVQMNTVEQSVFFLPSLWLYAVLLSDKGAAVGGLIWVIGRAIYAVRYIEDASKRGPGIMIATLAQLGLWLGAVYGVMRALIG